MSASPSHVPSVEDDALSLVQAQSALSRLIFEDANPVELLRGLHTFTGNQFSTAQLAFAYGDATPVTLKVVAEGASTAVRAADRRTILSDYPAAERLASLQSLTIQDVRAETTVPEAEHEWLRSRALRAMLVLPLVARGHLVGLISLAHDEPVALSPARLAALYHSAAQLAAALDHRRLLEAAQTTATQEQTINALVARFGDASGVDVLLRMALTELGQSLGARAGAIRLASPADVEGAVS